MIRTTQQMITIACPVCGEKSSVRRGNDRGLPTGSSYDRLRRCLNGHTFYTIEMLATKIKAKNPETGKAAKARPEIIPAVEVEGCARCELTHRFLEQIRDNIRVWNG